MDVLHDLMLAWGFCGARKSPLTCPGQSARVPRYSNLWALVITLRITKRTMWSGLHNPPAPAHGKQKTLGSGEASDLIGVCQNGRGEPAEIGPDISTRPGWQP